MSIGCHGECEQTFRHPVVLITLQFAAEMVSRRQPHSVYVFSWSVTGMDEKRYLVFWGQNNQ